MSGTSPTHGGALFPLDSRKRKERELSPVAPDPEPTPSRADAFWITPSRSGRVKKTYAHKRARSYASSAQEDLSDGAVVPSSRSPSPQSSPIKPRAQPRSTAIDVYVELPSNIRYFQTTARSASRHRAPTTIPDDPGMSGARPEPPRMDGPSTSRKKLVPYVEVPLRRTTSARKERRHISGFVSPARASDIHDVNVHVSRGRSFEQKAIAFPSPPPSEGDWTTCHHQDDQLTLSEALNRSFAAVSSYPTVSDNIPITAPSEPTAKREPGRPRPRSRGLAALGPIVSHSQSSSTRLRRTSSGNAASPAAPNSAPPVKRGPGRPRKNPLPPPEPEAAPAGGSRPRRSSARSKSGTRPTQLPSDEDEGDAAAVVDQLLYDPPSSPAGPSGSAPTDHDYAYHSVDVAPVARALERQAAEEAAMAFDADAGPPPVPMKRARGRPRGSKNKSTLAREQAACDERLARLTSSSRTRSAPAAPHVAESTVSSLPPVPIKRPRGRPRKSAPSAFSSSGFMDYTEPLKDPDDDALTAGPSTIPAKARGRSRTRRNSTSILPISSSSAASPAKSSQYYLDLDTMQWRRRGRSVSASPTKRRRSLSRATKKATEYVTSQLLCAALKTALVKAAATPKLAQDRTDDGLRVAPSGVLLFSDGKSDEPVPTLTPVFSGSWAILEDPRVTFDDGLVMKKLHEVVLGTGAFVRFGEARISRTARGRTVTVTVPCCCQSLRPVPPHTPSSRAGKRVAASPLECKGELTVSISEEAATREYAGLAKVLRTTVVVTH
ncbi:hypothetical protein BN946_scf184923.g2 [Trametes cinnabarina]|uniref:Uncharacterized protein n=1 Tax=Pycnoporus cinnabarinus TaxID=5643 RepID=A0A060SBC1_PYCCI|nr:hypothetical protein BN946_scf184923.g2 [Trametes cinnabarina]